MEKYRLFDTFQYTKKNEKLLIIFIKTKTFSLVLNQN